MHTVTCKVTCDKLMLTSGHFWDFQIYAIPIFTVIYMRCKSNIYCFHCNQSLPAHDKLYACACMLCIIDCLEHYIVYVTRYDKSMVNVVIYRFTNYAVVISVFNIPILYRHIILMISCGI